MNKQQIEAGLKYAENNLLKDDSHLWLDKMLMNNVVKPHGLDILDFGCGMGGFSVWMAKNFRCRVTGLDIDANHIHISNLLREKHCGPDDEITFRQIDILDYEPEMKFDLITLNDVVEHIPVNLLRRILRKLKTLLKEEGKMFVSFPPWESPYASHLNFVIKLPWCQYLPQRVLMQMIEKNNRELVGRHDLKGEYLGLNKMTYPVLAEIMNGEGLKEVFRKSHSKLNRFPGLEGRNFNKFLFKYLVTKELLIFEHAAVAEPTLQLV